MTDRTCVECGARFTPRRADQRRCQCCIEDMRDTGRNVTRAACVAVSALSPSQRDRLAGLLVGLA